MAQEIKIGVAGQFTEVDRGLRELDSNAASAAGSIGEIAAEAKQAAQEVDRLNEATRRLAQTRALLERDLRTNLSDDDTQTAIDNFNRLKSTGGVGTRNLRRFDDLEQYLLGQRTMYKRQSDADRERGASLAQIMQHTEHASGGGGGGHFPPVFGGFGFGGGFGGGLGGRAASAGMSLFKGGLALAGIGSLGAVIGQGVSSAGEESIGIDTLKRKMGDLGVDFDVLRSQVRSSGAGLGLTFTELARMGQQYASAVGNLTSGSNLRNAIATSGGFARGFGIDPNASLDFFATMRRVGGSTDDRRLSLQIADAIEKSGYGGKADEVLAAISDYTTISARQTLSIPNSGAFAGALTSLTSRGVNGLDPAGAAGLLSQADGAFRRGGAKGEASQNALFAALMGASPGLSPVALQALGEGGMFGTTRGIFGAGSALEGWAAPGQLNDMTTLQKMQQFIRRNYGGGQMGAAAMAGFAGTGIAGGKELLDLSIEDQNATQALASAAGLKGVNATSVAGLAKIANADKAGLQTMFDAMMSRKEVTDADRKMLGGALGSGDLQNIRVALAKLTDQYGQEQTEGDKTRQTISGVKDAITSLGTLLLGPLNVVRDAAAGLARQFVSGYRSGEINGRNLASGTDYQAKYNARGSRETAMLKQRMLEDAHKYDEMKADGGEVDISKIVAPDPTRQNDAAYERDMARFQALQRRAGPGAGRGSMSRSDQALWDKARDTKMSPRAARAMSYFMGTGMSRNGAAALVGNFLHESQLNPGAVAKGDAADGSDSRGIAQWNRERLSALKRFAAERGLDWESEEAQLKFASYELATKYKGVGDQLRAGGSVEALSDLVQGGYEVGTNRASRQGYSAMMAASGPATAQHVSFGEATVNINMPDGSRQRVVLKPQARPVATGTN